MSCDTRAGVAPFPLLRPYNLGFACFHIARFRVVGLVALLLAQCSASTAQYTYCTSLQRVSCDLIRARTRQLLALRSCGMPFLRDGLINAVMSLVSAGLFAAILGSLQL